MYNELLFPLDRDVQHNVSYSIMSKCQEGAVKYSSAGEVNAVITLERNQFVDNCKKLYGNFSTCKSAVSLDIQNTQSVYFRVSPRSSQYLRTMICHLCTARIHSFIDAISKFIFQNNLVMKNQGGLRIRADSRGSATSLKGWIHNNLFTDNYDKPAL